MTTSDATSRAAFTLDLLRGAGIDSVPLASTPSFGHLMEYLFARIDGRAAPRREQADARPTGAPSAAIAWGALHEIGLSSGYSPLVFVATAASRDSLRCFVGAHPSVLPSSETLAGHFSGAYRGVTASGESAPGPVGAEALNGIADFGEWVRVTGGPPALLQDAEETVVDIMARGMGAEPWILVVEAVPLPAAALRQMLSETGQVDSYLQSIETEQRTVGAVSASVTDKTVTLALGALAIAEKALDEAALEGGWLLRIHAGAESAGAALSAGALLSGCFRADELSVQPARVVRCGGGGAVVEPAWSSPVSLLPVLGAAVESGLTFPVSSSRLATVAGLPAHEHRGFALRKTAEFDVDLVPSAKIIASLGATVRDSSSARAPGPAPVDATWGLTARDLVRHVLVAGVTGSGKSVSMARILDGLDAAGLPFAVVEPAKAEYRRRLAHVSGLRSYSLGDGSADFRLNPFEPPRGTRVQTHVDHVRSLFNASFSLFAPLPQVLELCLSEIYVERGWDLTHNSNPRLPDHDLASREVRSLTFPTLGDLVFKIDEVVDRLGYSNEISMDVRAALRTRLDSLRMGAKGVLLDGPSTVDIAELLLDPIVLELELIGDEEEKCFIMGLLFVDLYEHRVAESAARNGGPPGRELEHFFVIEEAHRLLRAAPPSSDPESANTRGKAVEDFCNMLAEVRAYGQGFGICEQIPAKLAEDAIKNTNVKIVHRLLARDDRESLAACMCMSDEQCDVLPALPLGRAAVFAEGMDGPALVDVEMLKPRSGSGTAKKPAGSPAASRPPSGLMRTVTIWLAEEMLFPAGTVPERVLRWLRGEPNLHGIRSALSEGASTWCRQYLLDAHFEKELHERIVGASLPSLGANSLPARLGLLGKGVAEDLWAQLDVAAPQPFDVCVGACTDGPCLLIPLVTMLRPSVLRAATDQVARPHRDTAMDSSDLLRSDVRRSVGRLSPDLEKRLALCALARSTWSAGMGLSAATRLLAAAAKYLDNPAP